MKPNMRSRPCQETLVWLNGMAQTQHLWHYRQEQNLSSKLPDKFVHLLQVHGKIIATSVCAKMRETLLSQSPDDWQRAQHFLDLCLQWWAPSFSLSLASTINNDCRQLAKDAFVATTTASRDNTHEFCHKQQAWAITQAVHVSVHSNKADEVRVRCQMACWVWLRCTAAPSMIHAAMYSTIQHVDRFRKQIDQRAKNSRVGHDDLTHQSPATTSRDADCFGFLARQWATHGSVILHIRHRLHCKIELHKFDSIAINKEK